MHIATIMGTLIVASELALHQNFSFNGIIEALYYF